MKIVVYSIVRDRLEYTRKSFKALRKMAGIEFDHYVADNGSGDEMRDWLKSQKALGHIKHLVLNDENLGQNIAANALIDKAVEDNADWIMRWDNDAMPRTRRFLRKLVRQHAALQNAGALCVTSPKITKLLYPPEPLGLGSELGFKYEAVQILGGICRLHPAYIFHNWSTVGEFRFSRFGPLGFGEASEMAKFCAECGVQMVRLVEIEVEHMDGHDGQAEKMPEEHTWERREVGRYVSYGL